MNFIKKIINVENNNSLSNKVRRNNFELFKDLFYLYFDGKPLKILDIGGTQKYWEMMKFTDPEMIQVILINIEEQKVTLSNFKSIVMDATDLDLLDIDCDIIFSHSLIEHIGHEIFAQIVKYFEKPYFIQTPNKYFPMEPHFLIPMFQFMPLWLKKLMVRNSDIKNEIESIELLSKLELKRLFPNSEIHGGKILGLTQSFVVIKKQ